MPGIQSPVPVAACAISGGATTRIRIVATAAPPVLRSIAPTPAPNTAPRAPVIVEPATTRVTSPADIRKPYSVVGSAAATVAMSSPAPMALSTPPPTNTAVNCASIAWCRRGEARNIGTTVPWPYSLATAIVPNSPAMMKALAANATSDCWSSAVAMKALLPSASVANMTRAALIPPIATRTAKKPHGILVVVSLRISARMSRLHITGA